MGISDYSTIKNGDNVDIIAGENHSAVPTSVKLSHDTRVIKSDRVGTGSGYGAAVHLYDATDVAEFTTARDQSARALFCLGLLGKETYTGLVCRSSTTILTASLNKPFVMQDGIHLVLSEDGTQYHLKLYVAGSGLPGGGNLLWSTTRAGLGVGDYKWFHLRLDVLLKDNGDAVVRVYENDPVVNPIVPPNSPYTWVKVSPEIVVESGDLPAYAGVGPFSRQEAGDPGDAEIYFDWFECFYGA